MTNDAIQPIGFYIEPIILRLTILHHINRRRPQLAKAAVRDAYSAGRISEAEGDHYIRYYDLVGE